MFWKGGERGGRNQRKTDDGERIDLECVEFCVHGSLHAAIRANDAYVSQPSIGRISTQKVGKNLTNDWKIDGNPLS